eukprot:scaffold47049_cov54-Phaeocystis_antarctica.AAC.1
MPIAPHAYCAWAGSGRVWPTVTPPSLPAPPPASAAGAAASPVASARQRPTAVCPTVCGGSYSCAGPRRTGGSANRRPRRATSRRRRRCLTMRRRRRCSRKCGPAFTTPRSSCEEVYTLLQWALCEEVYSSMGCSMQGS